MKPQNVLVIPDVHAPYHDARAWQLVLQAARLLKPEHVMIMGDFCDFYAVSDHDKDPKRATQLDVELAVANGLLTELREACGEDARIQYIFGNHEDRLTRYLKTKAQALAYLPCLRIDALLGLAALGIKHIPYKDFTRLGKVVFTHDLGKAGRYAVHQAINDANHSVVIGHLHRFVTLVEGDAFGHPRVGACFGWLGDVKEVDYMHKLRAAKEWALGFGVGQLLPSGVIHFQPVPIVGYQAAVFGKILAA